MADEIDRLGSPPSAIIALLVSSAARDSPALLRYMGNIEPSTLNFRQPVLCSELIEAGLVHRMAQTPYFVPLVDFAISNQQTLTTTPDQLIDQLQVFDMQEEVDFVKKRLAARGRFESRMDNPNMAGDDEASLTGMVSGALRRWF